jgi:large subunit ribosomal protein L18
MSKLTRSEARERRHQRVRLSVSGTVQRPRLCVFRSHAEIYVQLIDDQTGNTLASASSVDHELREKMGGLTKVEQAKLVGKVIAERAKKIDITVIVFDRGGYRYFGRVKALADAARQAGLEF